MQFKHFSSGNNFETKGEEFIEVFTYTSLTKHSTHNGITLSVKVVGTCFFRVQSKCVVVVVVFTVDVWCNVGVEQVKWHSDDTS